MTSLVSCCPSPAGFVAAFAFVGSLLLLGVYWLVVTVARSQGGSPRQQQHRDKKGDAGDKKGDAGGKQALCKGRSPAETALSPTWLPPDLELPPDPTTLCSQPEHITLLETLQPFEHQYPVHPDTHRVCEVSIQVNVNVENIRGIPDWLSCERSEGYECCCASITPSEVSSSSSVSQSSLRESPHTGIMTSEDCSSAAVSLAPSSDNSSTSSMVSNVSSSQASLSVLADEADVDQSSRVQPGVGHPWAGLDEQSGPAAYPPCEAELASCFEDSSMQQHEEDVEIQPHVPTPPPEVPEVNSREMESPFYHHEGHSWQEQEQELGLQHIEDEDPRHAPASAPLTRQRSQKRAAMMAPIVQDLPFQDGAVRRKQKDRVPEEKTGKSYGLPSPVLEREQSFEKYNSRFQASQPFPPHRHPDYPTPPASRTGTHMHSAGSEEDSPLHCTESAHNLPGHCCYGCRLLDSLKRQRRRSGSLSEEPAAARPARRPSQVLMERIKNELSLLVS
ncbi:uncharacterized protein O3Q21_003366 [Podargus strigoides]